MRHYRFLLPDIGEGIAEAEIACWHVAVGDMVEEDAPLADMMTDKATIEMTAPVSGVVTELAGAAGDRIAIGSALVTFAIDNDGPDGTAKASADSGAPAPNPRPVPIPAASEISARSIAAPPTPAPAPAPSPAPAATLASHPSQSSAQPQPPAQRGHGRLYASPAVRHRARSLGIELDSLAGTGGRIRHADLDAFLLYNGNGGYRSVGITRPDEQVLVIGLRRRIADNVAASKRHIPHFTYVEELDVTRLEEMRAELNGDRGSKARLTILPLLLAAVCKVLPGYPMLNARYDDDAGIVHRSGAIHFGIATQTDAGLMVPVVRNAQTLNIWQLSAEIARLADAARRGKAKSDELSGSTITVTSLGPLGGIATTPVINRPEVAILGPNRVIERPVFSGRDVVAAKLMNLSISCDHRVVDGWDAASFVQAVKRIVEAPALVFAP